MKSKVKQILSVIMTICMLSTMIPLTAYGADVDFDDDATVTAEASEDTETDADIEVDEDTSTDDADVTVEEDEEEQNNTEEDIEESDEEDLFSSDESTEEFSDEAGENDLSTLYATYNNKATSKLDDFYKICFVDCGRKYFSVDSLEKIIDNASSAGFNYIELAVGNDGLRLLLDDMAINVGDKTYTSDDVKSAIKNGNTKYNNTFSKVINGYYYPYNPTVNELTQDEMDTIISYAKSKGMKVIPLLNTPGHMDAILSAANQLTDKTCSYNGSSRTIDVSNTTAVAFAEAIVQKYINYFAGKGCTMFNMGADEYANDIYTNGSMGFGNLQNSGKYSNYVSYVNKIADMIKGAGMHPMAFNDGIYFANNTADGSFDTDIVICYWSGGWSGYTPMSAIDLSDKRFNLINTNGNYYWVLGKSDAQCSAEKAAGFDKTSFSGSTINNPRGAMFCIWSDYPGAETESDVINKTADTIAAFGATLPESEKVEIKADYTTVENGGKFTVGSFVKLSFSNGEKIVSWNSSDEKVISLEGSGALEDNADEVVADETAYDAVIGTARKPGSSTITLTSENGSAYTTVLTVEADENNPEEKEITVTVNGTYTDILAGKFDGEYNTDNSSVATVETEYQNKAGESISYNASASASIAAYSTNYGRETYPASNLIDGDASTKYWSGSEQTVGAYAQVDIGTAIPFNTVRLTSSVNSGDVCEDAEVRVSEDGTKWVKIGSYTGSTTPTTFTNTQAKVRFIQVKITKAKANWWQLAEIEWGNTTDGEFTRMSASGTVSTEATDQTVVTFTGVSEGDATVQIGTTKYNIHVVKEDIKDVSPVTVEYWITNRQVTADNATSKAINAIDATVYSENGTKLSDLIPATGTLNNNDNVTQMAFWKGTLLAENHKQTIDKGVDQTMSGTDFNYIRYWDGQWSVSEDGQSWNSVKDSDQIVAYYLQVTTVTEEIVTKVVDWGENYSNYDSSNFVLMDYAVKYESGQQTPNTFPVSDKTLAFHCDSSDTTSVHQYESNNTMWYNYYREIGMIKADETADYEVYRITMTPSSDTNTTQVGSSAKYVSSYQYNGTEKVVWVDDEKDLGDFRDESLHANGYHVGGEATVPGVEITNRHAMLITYYVRAKVTDDSLTVRYVDKVSGAEFYNYNIAVDSGTTFKEGIALPEGGKGNLINGDVINKQGNTQIISSDLATMPKIGVDYRYSTYTCESVTISEDKKVVTLYYTFEKTHKFVIDYGLPLTITAQKLGLDEMTWDTSTATTYKYGNVELNKTAHTLTYTPKEVLPETETINLTLGQNGQTVTHIIYIYPASTVYYEEGFATDKTAFSGGSKGTANQNLAVLGKDENNYGYDGAYTSDSEKSGGSEATSKKKGDNATFTFTGTGVDIYANTTADAGSLTIKIADKSGIKQLAIVDTKMAGAQAKASTGYNVPVFSVTDLDHGTYTVTITHSMNDKAVKLDGFKVYNTLSNSIVYKDDDEDNPTFLEVRDLQFGKLTNIKDYGKDGRKVYAVGEQVYKDITQDVDNAQAVITVNGQVNTNIQQELYEKGPKNEVYLANGSSLIFTVDTEREVQLGLKGVNGDASYSLVTGTNRTGETVSTVDMFYTVKAKGVTGEQTITVTNTSENILSITKLKVCDDPNALQPLSVDSVVSALYAAGLKDPEQPTVTPTPTVTATIAPTQKPVQQIKLATPKLGKVVSAGYNALKLNWSKVNGANGYRVYVKVNGQWKALGNTKSTTYVHKKLETGKSYTYTVKAYKNTKYGTVWSSYDKKGITGKAALSAPSLRKAKRTSAKKATLSWKKVNGASGYVVYRKTNNGRWQIVKKITKGNITSFTDKKLSKGKKYTYTVRAYRTVGKKNIYSGYNKKGLKVK